MRAHFNAASITEIHHSRNFGTSLLALIGFSAGVSDTLAAAQPSKALALDDSAGVAKPIKTEAREHKND